MLDTIQVALLNKFKERKLASVYLLTYNTEFTNPEKWSEEFQNGITPLIDHPDILKLKKGPKENEYKVDSLAIKEFVSFINTKPLKLSKKFIFLYEAHCLSITVSNKLLKTIEELGNDYCLILFAPRNSTLLPTILSRAIKLTLPKVSGQDSSAINETKYSFRDFQKIKTPQELVNFLKTCEDEWEGEKKFIEFCIEESLLASQSSEQYAKLENLLKVLKDYEMAANFNNSRLSRLTPFFCL